MDSRPKDSREGGEMDEGERKEKRAGNERPKAD